MSLKLLRRSGDLVGTDSAQLCVVKPMSSTSGELLGEWRASPEVAGSGFAPSFPGIVSHGLAEAFPDVWGLIGDFPNAHRDGRLTRRKEGNVIWCGRRPCVAAIADQSR